ncbi:hypothetical protein L1049_002740 [Liquidambar formosana]|uniref:Uncharacterized protein n=1 Tax=Liquidambar formosana TaxID=63359 RepID=A0AAP0R8E9_LIQFO
MIKRRFYKMEHADRDNGTESSSSSSDSELEAEATEETEDDAMEEVKEDNESCSTSSGYEREDGSANEVDVDSSGLPINEDDALPEIDRENLLDSQLPGKHHAEILGTQSNIKIKKDSVPADGAGCILKCKSVFKCRLCPRIVCLTEETLRAHLESKRHARSEKLLEEGRLKLMLNSDGEIEEGEVNYAEQHSDIVSPTQDEGKKKKNSGRQRQRDRSRRKKIGNNSKLGKARHLTENPAKKRRKSEN